MKLFCSLAIALLLQGFAFAAEPFNATVVRVSDGDTFTVESGEKRTKVRLYGIDCPEIEQPQGQEAKAFVEKLLPLGGLVRLEEVDVDKYGRSVAIVTLPGGSTLEAELLNAGYAWVYGKYCKLPVCDEWRQLMKTARADGRGLWVSPSPIPPADWRKGKR